MHEEYGEEKDLEKKFKIFQRLSHMNEEDWNASKANGNRQFHNHDFNTTSSTQNNNDPA